MAEEFKTHIRRALAPRLLVIWDGSPFHRRTLVREFVAGSGGRVLAQPMSPLIRMPG